MNASAQLSKKQRIQEALKRKSALEAKLERCNYLVKLAETKKASSAAIETSDKPYAEPAEALRTRPLMERASSGVSVRSVFQAKVEKTQMTQFTQFDVSLEEVDDDNSNAHVLEIPFRDSTKRALSTLQASANFLNVLEANTQINFETYLRDQVKNAVCYEIHSQSLQLAWIDDTYLHCAQWTNGDWTTQKIPQDVEKSIEARMRFSNNAQYLVIFSESRGVYRYSISESLPSIEESVRFDGGEVEYRDILVTDNGVIILWTDTIITLSDSLLVYASSSTIEQVSAVHNSNAILALTDKDLTMIRLTDRTVLFTLSLVDVQACIVLNESALIKLIHTIVPRTLLQSKTTGFAFDPMISILGHENSTFCFGVAILPSFNADEQAQTVVVREYSSPEPIDVHSLAVVEDSKHSRAVIIGLTTQGESLEWEVLTAGLKS